MSEAIAEMVLPGTYIEVRSEGLISAGAISTGNLGVVGTAAKGFRNQVRLISSYAEALDTFGSPDSFVSPISTGSPLTLVRTMQMAFAGGARNVFAVRVGAGDPVPASKALLTDKGAAAITITALNPGSWGNAIGFSAGPTAAGAPSVAVSYGATVETFTGPTIGDVATAMKTSTLVSATALDSNGVKAAAFTPVVSDKLSGGADLAGIDASNIVDALAALETQPVNILIVGGLSSAKARSQVGAHLDATENAGAERIAILGADSSDVAAVVNEASGVNDDRIVLVAPGVKSADTTGALVTLPPSYLAAMVAGQLASLAPHISLTNKTLPVADLDVAYSSTMAKTLLQNRVLVVRKKFGFQVLKGITSEDGAFRSISVRRIVDYAKAGVRSGADPYIGKLNNVRVRGALRATLDGFLSQMILDEMLVGYQLDVSATRAQEIQGIAVVSMTLQPTFSIDFIRVTMTLQ